MVKSMISSDRKNPVDSCHTDLSLFANQFCPKVRIQTTTGTFEDADGHVRVYPPADTREQDVDDIEGKLAARCVDILVEKGVFIYAAVYD